ncbi:DNA-binding protein [Roseateles toxinivorans]|uniref:Plasmid replication DNA-binding protein KfrA n=1 Tax=Roseateles toxinivorans TaxID=270368 RepID=A0A4R6QT39_9BURK|nr:DNA-binding protein [Roseateles toxinivorans]TDP74724.1 plasmid replication DNA-binding protein KfrA [Roseateles toxinivorans]
MARGITEDEVWKACDALLLEGARPTIERVRQKLGRGSPNTVSPMLETWFKHLGARIKDPGAFSAPATMPDPVHQAAQHLWEVAQAEARHDFDERLRASLAEAAATVDAEKDRSALADAAAASAAARAAALQTELVQVREALEGARAAHAGTAARLDDARLQCSGLLADLVQARLTADETRARADAAVSAADERAQGAERRAALEIERERQLRAKAEKSIESVAKRFEESLKAQIAASEQLTAAEGRLAQLKADSRQRELSLLALVDERDVRIRLLEAGLADAQRELAGRTAQEVLLSELVAKLGPAVKQAGANEVDVAHASRRGSKRKREAA